MAGPCAEGREVWSCLDGLDEDGSSAPEMGPTLGTLRASRVCSLVCITGGIRT